MSETDPEENPDQSEKAQVLGPDVHKSVARAKKSADWFYFKLLVPLSVIGGAVALFVWLFDVFDSSNDAATKDDITAALEGKRVVDEQELQIMVFRLIQQQSQSADDFSGLDARLISNGSRDILTSDDSSLSGIKLQLAGGQLSEAVNGLESLAGSESDAQKAARNWREAGILNASRNPERARTALERARSLAPDDFWTELTLSRVCYKLWDGGCAWEAAQYAVLLARTAEQKAASHIALGHGLSLSGETDFAVDAFETAVQSLEALVQVEPENVDYAWLHLDALKELYLANDDVQDYDETERIAARALTAAQKLNQMEPSVWVLEEISGILTWYGDALYFGQDDPTGAKASYQEALSVQMEIAAQRGDTEDGLFGLLGPLKNLSNIARSIGDKTGERQAYEDMIEVNKKLYDVAPHWVYAESIAYSHGRIARLKENDQTQQWQAAIDWTNITLSRDELESENRASIEEDLSFYTQRLADATP